MEKVVLAYSGGLDTSVAIKWLQEKGYEVFALAVDVGQPGDLQKVRDKAINIGAIESLVIDAKEEFANDFVVPALKANAMYENKYPLATALARPLIGKYLVDTAIGAGAGYVAHGCTAKGNDQVRFELAIKALGPNLKVIAPARVWGMTREDSIEYAKKHGIEIEAKKESPYSVDENIWGRSAECGLLEDPWVEPPEDAFDWTVNPAETPDDPLYVNIIFEKGIPVSVDGEEPGITGVISKLNEIGGKYGVGRIDMVEDRVVGIKSREIYEAPAGTILTMAHRELEMLVLEKDVLQYKQKLEADYAKLVYNGQWFSPLKEALDAFIEKTQEEVSGELRLKFFKGSVTIAGRQSKNSLYDLGMATYEKGDVFKHDAAEGFIELFGLPLTQWAKRKVKK